ncbi:GWxTD domain-containing protein [Brumimicrobium aurantiacum]|uniref:GWxTD domain-containing protein n=1 Tax=Brumimicrobium aurantiacum TaxID=1737063 RepID=A0A3E1F109_9FLAO|nr:GWxTD domain-containing protein [Brumimicrobium aurantiacum]RFC55512.1 GWxTD domain-containing protein [Brumimicrobium aurantiacum]
MKNYIILLISTIFLAFVGFGQDKNLKVFLSEGQFYAPDAGNYIEIQLNFVGHSLKYIEREGEQFAEVEVSQVFSKNDTVIVADKYLLKSPLVIDSLVEDFHDIQKYLLKPGEYRYDLSIKDVNSEKEPTSVTKSIEIDDLSKDVIFSSFTAAESMVANPKMQSIFTKVGYDVIPMIGNYYPTEIQNLLYYSEVYNTDKALNDSVYIVEQKLIGRNVNFDLDKYTRYFRYTTSPIRPIAKVIDISMLPTGSYAVELNLLNREKKVLARSTFDFDRNNTDEVNSIAFESVVVDPAFEASIPNDSTGYYVASLIPISRQGEVKNLIALLKEKDSVQNKKYLQAFWKQTNPENPFESWMRYKAQVQKVEKLFATNYQVGFETDRGRVYLEYGAPNNVYEQPSSPSEYPYEIWQYDQIKQFSNRRFIFYSKTNLNKDYTLLHSDMLGELQNYRWKYALNKRNSPDQNLDDPDGGANEHFGGNSSRYYNSY